MCVQIDTLDVLLLDYNEQFRVPWWVLYFVLGCIGSVPVFLSQSGKVDFNKLFKAAQGVAQ
mgnify:CR=1 FL=1